jgi:hypothetical protein
MAAATSSGFASFFRGVWRSMAAASFPVLSNDARNGVSVGPGATTFTLICRDATSRARALLNPMIPPFAPE